MPVNFKVYIAEDKEYFEYEEGLGAKKKGFALSQSLLDLLYLDMDGALFEKMGTDLRQLYSEKSTQLADEIRNGLDTIAKKHVYFELVRLDWLDRLEQAEQRHFEDVIDLLPYKQLTHIPSEIVQIQNQVKFLFENTLDVLSPKKPIPQKLAEYYAEKENTNGLDFFPFQPMTLRFERIDRKTFTEVLYPKDIYEIIEYFIRKFLLRELPFRVCKNCGKYFLLTGPSNTEYCDRPFDREGRTCKQIGSMLVWERKKKENPAFLAYSKAYKRRFAWIKYGKITQEAFYEWSEQARKMREQCANGKISLDEFKEWLE